MSNLSDLDDDFAVALKRKPVASLPQPEIPNGRFTLMFPCGTHKTLRIHTAQRGTLSGRRIVSLLIGPDNSADYQSFGELVDSPAGFVVWKSSRGKKPEEYVGLVVKMLRGEVIDGHELIESRNCLRCNRLLTTPSAVLRGVGDECAKKRAGK